RAARRDLARVRLLVDAALAARLPLEVLDDVGHVDGRSIDARFTERAIEQLARRSDERVPAQVFVVPRLLADEHQLRFLRAFAEDRLRAAAPQIARLTVLRGAADLVDRRPIGNQLR